MTVLTDVFSPDGFSVVSLTDAIQKMPPMPTQIGDMGLFRQIPVATPTVAIEESHGVLALIPTTARGGPGIPAHDSNRKLRQFKIPRICSEDTVKADDVIGVRAFGSSDAMSGTGEVVGRKFETMKRSVEVTQELARRGAINGKIYYPEDSIDGDLDLFTEFGMTSQSSDQTSVDFVYGTDTTNLIGDKIPSIRDAVESALGATPYTGIVALCGRTFFRNLINQGTIKALYDAAQKQWNLQAVGMAPGEQNRMTLTVGDVTFIEYYGKVGSSDGVGTDGLFQVAAEARAFPIGADIFHSIVGPGDFEEAIGSMGQPMYARQWASPDGRAQNLEVQSNVLNICTRPKALIRLHTST